MSYYFTKTIAYDYEDAIERVTEALAGEGFGVLTQIDVQKTMKEKLGVEFRRYRILGACNPQFSHQALTVEDKAGLMMPCNVVVQEAGEGKSEVSAIDPVASMMAIENPEVIAVAGWVRDKLAKVIESL